MSLFGRYMMMRAAYEARFIHFADKAVEQWALAHFDRDRDGRLSIDEAAAVTDAQFKAANPPWETFTTFDEMVYFTGLQNIGNVNWNASAWGDIKKNPLYSVSLNSFSRGDNIAARRVCINGLLRAERFYTTSLHLGPKGLINSLPWNYNNNTLEEVTISKANRNNKVENNFILSYDGTIAYKAFGRERDLTVPNGVKKIIQWVIADNAIRSIILPDSVEEIGYLFSNAKMERCDIGAGVKKIGNSFLYNSNKLKYLILRGRLPQEPKLVLKHKFDIYVQAGDIDYYKTLLPAPYNTYLKPISELP